MFDLQTDSQGNFYFLKGGDAWRRNASIGRYSCRQASPQQEGPA